MFNHRIGLEVEFTGITRAEAAEIVAKHLGGTKEHIGGTYDAYEVTAPDGRVWKLMSDASLRAEKKENDRTVSAGSNYRVELVSPILTYREDIAKLQEMIRKLRRAGAFTNDTMGIHIHLDGAPHTARSIKNFINIIASKNHLLYKALQIKPERIGYCKEIDRNLVERIRREKPKTLAHIERIWYNGDTGHSRGHYDSSRYTVLNLHAFFTRHHTVELRMFNSTLHAGKIRSYIVLALALNNQALTQKSASTRQPQEANDYLILVCEAHYIRSTRRVKIRDAHLPQPNRPDRR